MRTTILLAAAVLAAPAFAEPLFSNASANPSIPALGLSSTSQSGVAAPPGFQYSEVPGLGTECNAVAGFSSHPAGAEGHFRFADDFTVPPGAGWNLDAITLYAYQPGAGGPNSPISGVNIRVWNARPGDVDSQIIWGDTTTNRLTSSTALGAYRIYNSVTQPLPTAPDSTRPIWATVGLLDGLHLPPGTYWIDWQYTSVNPDAAVYSPGATVVGVRTQGGWNALQFRAAVGAIPGGWVALADSGKPAAAADHPQDLPFILHGSPTPLCDPDYDQNGVADQDDVAYLVNIIAGGENTTGRDPDFDQNGVADQDDTFALINTIAGGPCP